MPEDNMEFMHDRKVIFWVRQGHALSPPVQQAGFLPGTVWLEVHGMPRKQLPDYRVDRWVYAPDADGLAMLGSEEGRAAILADFDYLCLAPADLADRGVREGIPHHRRILQVRWQTKPLHDLLADFAELVQLGAAYYHIVLTADKAEDGLLPLLLLKRLGRNDVMAYQDGAEGAWTRILGTAFGTPAIMCTDAALPLPDGSLPMAQLVSDYGLPTRPSVEAVMGIAGNPVFRSLSPRLHNAAYRQNGRKAIYLPFHVQDYPEFFSGLVHAAGWQELGCKIEGLTVVSPFKEAGFRLANRVEHPISGITQSCNLVVCRQGQWVADSTDPLAVQAALVQLGVEPKAMRVAVIGCGGAGRAAALTLVGAGAEVTMFNRSFERGALAARQLNIDFQPLDALTPGLFDILVNATPLGKKPGEYPLDPSLVPLSSVFIDYAYSEQPTPVIQALRARGVACVDGRGVLVIQVRRQYAAMTGEEMPLALATHLATPSMNLLTTPSPTYGNPQV
jgi:3-dehydroquinate dehydratase / shikimate dehydrogenase